MARAAPGDDRPVALQPDAARGAHRGAAPGADAGIAPASALALEAVAARSAFETARRGELAFLTPVAGAPGFPRALARSFGDLRLAGLSRADLAAAGDGPGHARLVAPRVGSRARARRGARRRSHAAVRSGARRRGRARRSWRARCVLLDIEIVSPVEEAFVLRAGRRRRRPCWPRCCRRIATRAGSGPPRARSSRRARRSGTPDLVGDPDAPVRRRGPAGATSDGSFEFFSAPGEGRECVEIARRLLREARRGVRLRRDGRPRARAGALPRAARARARARRTCPRGSSAARGVRTRPAARSWRCWRARGKGCRPTALPSICRWGSCRPPVRSRPAGCRPATSCSPPLHRATRRRAVDDAGARPPSSRPPTTQPRDCRHAARAAPVGADARRGGGHRRRSRALEAAPARAGRGAARAARGGEPGRSRLLADGGARRAMPRGSRTSRRSRCRSSRRWPRGPSAPRGASGWSASSSSRRACCARRRTCCACSPTCGRWPRGPGGARRGPRRAARAPAARRGRAAGPPLRPRLRRHSGPGARPHRSASSSCRASPSACFRRSRGRIRCCPTRRAAS